MSVNPFRRTTSANHCDAENVTPHSISKYADPIIKVPVLLQEVSIQIPMHAEIEFPEGEEVLEIKTIKKRTYLTQCRLLNRAPHKGAYPRDYKAKLFISGFVRKNIQYAANPVVDDAGEILSQLRSLTVEVPFDCVAEVDGFMNLPVGPYTDFRDEFGYLISQELPNGRDFARKDRLDGTDLSQFHQTSTEFFNELPYCELVRADIIEFDESLNRNPFADDNEFVVGEGTFTRMSEKMVLDLRLKVLQLQQVRVNSLGVYDQKESE
ncbi:CsxC family protein [Jeotgalibacillus proteolyticus]|uniref:CsxC family protein n=1 Tax=Jeotgalibacillus proteolyticus TaxID=2082395 RepID=UPI003CF5476F